MKMFRKLINIGLVSLIILFTLSVFQNYTKLKEARSTIKNEQEEVDKLLKEQKEIQKKLKEVENDAFIEKQIRDELGLSKENEVVLVMPEEDIVKSLAPKKGVEELEKPMPNWEKWRRLFF